MRVIVTLTSISARLPILRYTLLSLLEQSYKVDRIIVSLSKEPYLLDEGITELPEWLASMVAHHAVDVNWVDNIGPYRKLMPVYREFSDEEWMVTCDDDVIYGDEWLASLIQCGKENPDAIVCGRARLPVKNCFNGWQSYINWPLVPSGSFGKDLLPIGVAGVLYRKTLLDSAIMNSEDFKELAPMQDDLWFNLARKVAGTNVVTSPNAACYVYPIETPIALSDSNVLTSSSRWHKFFKAFFERVIVKLKGYLGFSVCGNDIVIKKLDAHLRKLDISH